MFKFQFFFLGLLSTERHNQICTFIIQASFAYVVDPPEFQVLPDGRLVFLPPADISEVNYADEKIVNVSLLFFWFSQSIFPNVDAYVIL